MWSQLFVGYEKWLWPFVSNWKKILAAQWVMEYDDICNVAP
jgi:hypothetical protein